MWKLFRRLLSKPPMMEHRPAPEPRRRSSRPAVTTTQTHRSIHLNLSIFNWHRGGGGTARPARQGAGRSLLDLRVLDWAFGPRPPAPPTAARVAAAIARADKARERTAARQQIKRQPAPASRPATRADQAELRRLQRERAAGEAQRQQQAAQQQTVVVDAAYRVADKPVPVEEYHRKDGTYVPGHRRNKPGEGEET